MLIHVRPRCYGPLGRHTAELHEFSIPDFGLFLTSKGDLVTRHPYPNKCYSVGCRPDGLRADDGLLVEVAKRVDRFKTIALWSITFGQKQWTATHETQYVVLDQEHDAITDDMTMWYGSAEWQARWPETVQGPPSSAEPCFDVFDTGTRLNVDVDSWFRDFKLNCPPPVDGAIQYRHTTFYTPTIERERLDARRKTLRDVRLPPARMVIAA